MRALAAALALTLAATAAWAQTAAPAAPPVAGAEPFAPGPPEDLVGAVDLCVRWGDDPAHLSDVILLASSGDKDLDAKIPELIRSIPYPRPQDDTGEWFGLSLSFGAAPPHAALPDCAAVARGAEDGA